MKGNQTGFLHASYTLRGKDSSQNSIETKTYTVISSPCKVNALMMNKMQQNVLTLMPHGGLNMINYQKDVVVTF